MARSQSEKKISLTEAAAWLFYFVTLLPLWILAFFNYPSADDINMGLPAHEAFAATGNILAAWGQGIYMAWYDYLHWMGYFTSTALMSVPPSVFGIRFYPAGAIFLSLCLTAATAFFLHTLLVRLAGMGRRACSILSALLLFLTIQSLPAGMARVETLYWYCSGANYILTWCLGLVFLALFIRAGLDGKRRPLTVITGCAVGFLVGGGNYMTALTCAIITVLAIAGMGVSLKRGGRSLRELLPLILPALFLFAGFTASCLAPGNAVREEAVSGFGAVKSILISLHYTAWYCIATWTRAEHLLMMLFLAPLFWEQAPRMRLSWRYPFAVCVLSYGLASANVTPPLYALGNIVAGRLQAMYYIQYILLLILTEGYLIGWLRMRVLRVAEGDTGEDGVRRRRYYLGGVALFFAVISLLCAGAEPDYYMGTEAVRELTDGSAAGYRRENEERFAVLLDPAVQDAVLKQFTNKPALLWYSDIDTEPGNWINDGLARYFHKNSVRGIAAEDADTGERGQ
ncbi:MAG: hypothetical protein IKO80_10400 [Lachnospiraceae bacterium]|nr:hypothetical protein [Lachnospiraceae bacterium]